MRLYPTVKAPITTNIQLIAMGWSAAESPLPLPDPGVAVTVTVFLAGPTVCVVTMPVVQPKSNNGQSVTV